MRKSRAYLKLVNLTWVALTRIRSFTVLELVIVITLISFIVAYTLPNYYRSVMRAREKDIIAQLTIIHSAQNFHFQNQGTYWGPGIDTDAVNQGLGLSLIENNTTYDCDAPGATTYECHGVEGGSSPFTFRVTEVPLQLGVNPCCESGSCPTPANNC